MFRSKAYRYNNERIVLLLTLLMVGLVIVLTSTMTFCLSGVLILVMFVLSAVMIRAHHQALIDHAFRVEINRAPGLTAVFEACAKKLQPGPVEAYLVSQDRMNAYTLGISSPKVLVLFTPLLEVMDPQELSFIIGHEMGHVALGHTWLNTLVGGLAGVPVPFGAAVVLFTAFRWWNRMCEYSADRAGLLACGSLDKAIVALVKLVAPEVRSQADFDRALAMIDAEDDEITNRVAAAFQSHPMLIRRINHLRKYARTAEYRRLQVGVNGNMGASDMAAVQPQVYDSGILAREPAAPPPPPESAEPEKPPPPPEERWPWLKIGD